MGVKNGNRTLVYTCCDEKYAVFIPLFCAAILYTNKNVDIEIGTSLSRLNKKQEVALDELRRMHPNSTILIKHDFFVEEKGRARMSDGKLVEFGTVRFITTPIIKDQYTYISDIDIISLDEDFYLCHIEDMNNNNRKYSNIIRNTQPLRMSGLHFCCTDLHYPLELNDIDIETTDEVVLMKIVQKKQKLDFNSRFRPVHGIHMSTNRPCVEGGGGQDGSHMNGIIVKRMMIINQSGMHLK